MSANGGLPEKANAERCISYLIPPISTSLGPAPRMREPNADRGAVPARARFHRCHRARAPKRAVAAEAVLAARLGPTTIVATTAARSSLDANVLVIARRTPALYVSLKCTRLGPRQV